MKAYDKSNIKFQTGSENTLSNLVNTRQRRSEYASKIKKPLKIPISRDVTVTLSVVDMSLVFVY